MRRRADLVLVERGIVPSRQKARELIKGRAVTCDGKTVQKPGQLARPNSDFHVDKAALRWASRGGLKLEYALEKFSLPNLSERICLDLGASTGGFTDVLLSYGATFVYAVDVGHGQLAAHLAADKRVGNLEKTNAKNLNDKIITQPLDFVTCDVSFISVTKALGQALSLVRPGGWQVSLIKPQFEAGREAVGKKGVVRDPAVHAAICADIQPWLAAEMGWSVIGVTESPLRGPEGNIEFLIAGRRPAAGDGARL